MMYPLPTSASTRRRQAVEADATRSAQDGIAGSHTAIVRLPAASVLASVLALVVGLQCAGSHDRYFRHVYVNGTHSIVGTYEVPPESARYIECYRVTSNRRGSVTRVAHLFKGHPMASSQFGDDVASVVLRHLNGYTEMSFLDPDGKRTADSAGVEAIRLRRDTLGRWATRLQLQADGTVCTDSYGVTLYSESLGVSPNTSREVYLDTAPGGNRRTPVARVAIRPGIWESRRVFDDEWRCVRIEARGKSGQRVNGSDGVCERVYSYDSLGNQSSVYFFDSAGRSTTDTNGTHGYWLFYDARGCLTKRISVDTVGWPHPDRWGVGMQTILYDAAGLGVSKCNLLSADTLTEDGDGVALENYSYDSVGKLIGASFFGADGAPTKHPRFGASIRLDIDTLGNGECRSYDEYGRPYSCSYLGAAIVRSAYKDKAGGWVTAYFDQWGQGVRVDTLTDEGHTLSTSYIENGGHPAFRGDILATGLRIQWWDKNERMTDIELRH